MRPYLSRWPCVTYLPSPLHPLQELQFAQDSEAEDGWIETEDEEADELLFLGDTGPSGASPGATDAAGDEMDDIESMLF